MPNYFKMLNKRTDKVNRRIYYQRSCKSTQELLDFPNVETIQIMLEGFI